MACTQLNQVRPTDINNVAAALKRAGRAAKQGRGHQYPLLCSNAASLPACREGAEPLRVKNVGLCD